MIKNIKIYVVLYCLLITNSANAVIYDTLSTDAIGGTANMPMTNISYDPLIGRQAIKTQIKQCQPITTCLVGVDLRTSTLIQLSAEIKDYILGDEYHFRAIKKSKNTMVVYTTDNNQSTNLTIITKEDDIYPILLSSSSTVDLMVQLDSRSIEQRSIVASSTQTKKVNSISDTKKVDRTIKKVKTVFIGSLSEYIDVDYIDKPLTEFLIDILPSWDVRFGRGLNTNKLVSVTVEKSAKLSRQDAVNQVLSKFSYKALYYNQKRIIVITGDKGNL